MIDITDKTQFQDYLQKYPVVVLDVWAEWCSPCKYLSPIFENYAAKYSSPQALFCKNNIETRIFDDVKGLPTVRFYVQGKLVREMLGADVKELEQIIGELFPSSQQSQQQQQLQHPPQDAPSFRKKQGGNSGSGYKSFASY